MKSIQEIQIEVEQKWQADIDLFDTLAKTRFREFIEQNGLKVSKGTGGALGGRCLDGEVVMPNFKGAYNHIESAKYEAALDVLGRLDHGKRVIDFLLSAFPVDYQKFFGEQGFYKHMLRCRNEIERTRNSLFETLSPAKGGLEKKRTIVIVEEHKAGLKIALDNISNTLLYYDLLLKHVDWWFSKYGVKTETNKDARKHPCWDKLVVVAYRMILIHVTTLPAEANRLTATLLAVIYPDIWGKHPIKNNSELIRQRIFKIDNPI